MHNAKLLELAYLKQRLSLPVELSLVAAMNAVKVDMQTAHVFVNGIDDREWTMTAAEMQAEEAEKQAAINKSNADNEAEKLRQTFKG